MKRVTILYKFIVCIPLRLDLLAKLKSYLNKFILIAHFGAAACDSYDYEYSPVTRSFSELTYCKQEPTDKENEDYLNPNLWSQTMSCRIMKGVNQQYVVWYNLITPAKFKEQKSKLHRKLMKVLWVKAQKKRSFYYYLWLERTRIYPHIRTQQLRSTMVTAQIDQVNIIIIPKKFLIIKINV